MYNVMNNSTKCSPFLSAILVFCECFITELLQLPLILGYVLENSVTGMLVCTICHAACTDPSVDDVFFFFFFFY